MRQFPREPAAIYAESFRRIDALLAPYGLEPDVYPVVRRVVHATADLEYVASLRFSPGAVGTAVAAIRAGAHIVTDAVMVSAGIQRQRAEAFGSRAHCAIADTEAVALAGAEGITRAMAGVRLLAKRHPEAIVVVGNAPTALYEALALAESGAARPPVIIGVPVGFVSTVEAKAALMASRGTAWISNVGPKGGSAVAAAIVNALLALGNERA